MKRILLVASLFACMATATAQKNKKDSAALKKVSDTIPAAPPITDATLLISINDLRASIARLSDIIPNTSFLKVQADFEIIIQNAVNRLYKKK